MLGTVSPAYLIGAKSRPPECSIVKLDIAWNKEPHPSLFIIASQVPLYLQTLSSDTMMMDKGLKQPDMEKILEAMKTELEAHTKRGHWKVIKKNSLPAGRKALPMVWSMKQKQNIIGEITKWKARLCAEGHRSIEGVEYWNTYSPVVSWSTVQLMLCIFIATDWHMESVDFVIAFPQAPIKTDIFMQLPRAPNNFKIPD